MGSTKVKLFDYSIENSIKISFLGTIGKSSLELKKAWLKAKLTGKGNPPATVGSEDEMINKIASTPGAIGFISSSKVNDQVKVLATF
ncbi:MAG: hypothetical protein JEY94_05510 [Melioribacteraceae bacterium]|nr:hypothetical protein [Melioribacteraceae bacterium]